MLHPESYEWTIYFLSLLSIMVLGSLQSAKATKNKFKIRIEYIRKICLAVFILTSSYWIITFPIVGSYNNFSEKSDYPANISVEKEADYIKEHRQQIENLGRELEKTKSELKAVSERINLILQIIMFGLLYFGVSWIISSNKKDSEGNQDNLSLNL